MKKTIIYTACIWAISATVLTSCEDMFGSFLDKQPSNELTEDQVFSEWETTKQFHFDTYNFLRHGACRINNSWMDAATDLAETSYANGGTRTSFNIGNYYAAGGASELTDTWEHYYRGIRKCNMLLSRIDDVPKPTDLSTTQYETDKTNYKAEAHFLRAYFYWEMFLRYGPVPIVTKVLDPDGDLLSEYTTRPSVKEYVVDFVLKELKECENDLMTKGGATDIQGRITKPIARALYSRVMLYMASERFSSDPSFDEESRVTWQQAQDAAQGFITDYGTNYGLYVADQNNPIVCYTNAILKNTFDQNNNEVIFWRNDVMVGWSAIYNDTPVGEGGNGGLCPSQNLVDMYDMSDGSSPFASYDETGAPEYSSEATGFTPAINSASKYNDNDPYNGRDPRLTATVLYNGASWGNGVINVLKGQRDNPTGNANATPTGYYVRKYIPENILNNNHSGSNYRNWIIIRYAEILLNYAEALNENNGSREDVLNALQPLRDRAGISGKLTDRTDLDSKEARRNFIRKERTVELAFEDHRAWDLRRWNVAEDALKRPIYGIDITKKNGKYTYTRKIAQERKFDEKMYLYPIPEGEVWKTNIENNPGWN